MSLPDVAAPHHESRETRKNYHMRNINIGVAHGGGTLELDVQTFLLTRLLLTANSGGGKSFLIRRLAEQLCKIMPVIIIDPEGEFATLREKFDFVLVGKGGETPTDCRSAKLVMHKLLELRASAVIDLYDLSIAERHRYVKLISEAAIDAPKELWRPTTFIFDEVHVFCPENGKGESEAKNAVLGFPTKGRKRQFGSIFATQRLAKLSKDARAEFLNRMIGMTFEPDDLKAAAGILGVTDAADFNKMMRTMQPGNFFSFGRAICLEQTLVKVGPVETSHEIQNAKFGVTAPPPPAEIKKLLPSLADLPKEAEEKAHTEQSLRLKVRELEAKLSAPALPPATKLEKVEVPIIRASERSAINHIIAEFHGQMRRLKDCEASFIKQREMAEASMKRAEPYLQKLSERIELLTEVTGRNKNHFKQPEAKLLPAGIVLAKRYEKNEKNHPMVESGDFTPNSTQQRILNALSWYESIGVDEPTNLQVGAIALIDPSGGHFSNIVGPLSTNGLVQRGNSSMKLTVAGRTLAVIPDRIATIQEYHDMLRARVRKSKSASGKSVEMLDHIINHAGHEITVEEIGRVVGIDPSGGHFSNTIGPLGTLGFIERNRGTTEILFPKGLQ